MDCSMPGLPVYHQLLEFTQTHIHCLGHAIQPPHPLLSPSAFNRSQHQGLFQWVGSLHQVAKVLEVQLQPSVLPMNIQDWSLGWTGWISLQSKGLTVKSLLQHHCSKASIWHSSFLYSPTQIHNITTGKTIALTRWPFVSLFNFY